MSNSTEHLSSDCRSPSLVVFHIVLLYLLFFMFPIALLLNGIAGWVSLHLDSTSTFIVYLKNLVAADLLITLMIPLKAASMLPGATVEFRAFICHYAGVSFYCSSYTNIVLMGLISLDHFFKIVRLRGKVLGQNMKFSVIMSTLVWILLFGGTAIPNIFLTDQVPATQTDDLCTSLKPPAGKNFHKYVVLFMEILFWCVNILIVFCYICITMKVLQTLGAITDGERRKPSCKSSWSFLFFGCALCHSTQYSYDTKWILWHWCLHSNMVKDSQWISHLDVCYQCLPRPSSLHLPVQGVQRKN